MRIRRVDTVDQFHELQEDWEVAYAADHQATVFVSWAWLRGWFEVTPHEWFVLVARPDDASHGVGFFPLSVDRRQRRLQMGGYPRADYTGFVCLPEYQKEAVEAFAVFVQRQLRWERFRMEDVIDARLDHFLEYFPRRSFDVCRREGVSCPYVPLPDTWEQFLQDSLGQRTRKNFRRYVKRIEGRSELEVTSVRADNLEGQIDAFLTLYQMRWGPQPEHALHRFRIVFQRCFEGDVFWLNVLWSEDTPIAADAGFVDRWRKVWSSYLGGWDDRFARLSPGSLLMAHNIRYAIEHGFQVYDFLRGAEDYKFAFGTRERFTIDAIITRRSLQLAAKGLARRLRSGFR